MTRVVTIRELPARESDRLLADKRFARLGPYTCSQCKATTGFTRRIFHITGVPKKEHDSEATQQWLKLHFRRRYAIDFAFFKTHAQKLFVDSARCGSCAATAIVYDIDLTDEFIAEVAERIGQPAAQLKSELLKTYAALRQE
jgi:hypothetical protein